MQYSEFFSVLPNITIRYLHIITLFGFYMGISCTFVLLNH